MLIFNLNLFPPSPLSFCLTAGDGGASYNPNVNPHATGHESASGRLMLGGQMDQDSGPANQVDRGESGDEGGDEGSERVAEDCAESQ